MPVYVGVFPECKDLMLEILFKGEVVEVDCPNRSHLRDYLVYKGLHGVIKKDGTKVGIILYLMSSQNE